MLAFVVQISFAQERTISGTVSDESGPLPQVSVLKKGTTKGTETDFNGNYSIQAKTGDILVFSFVGMQTVEKVIGIANTINVTLKDDDNNILDEVVVVGYKGAVNNSKLTAAVSVVDSEKIEQVPISSLDQVLQGVAAGVNVNAVSGQPGQSGTIVIRGSKSINGDIEPLFVIDGVPVDQDNFRSLNQDDIQSISVLKDAEATSVYGNRGAGGVVLVTTKSGKVGQKLSIKYSSLYGITSRPDSKFEVMNTRQYLNFQRDLLPGTQFGDGLTVPELNALINQANTDWSDVFFRKGKTLSHQLSFTSGGENSSSYSSIQYFNQEGVTLGSDLKRFSFRTNNSGSSVDKKFNYSTRVTLNYSISNFIVDAARNDGTGSANNQNTGGQLDNAFLVPYIGLPYLSPYGPNGTTNILGSVLSGYYNADGSVNNTGASGFLNTPFIALNSAAMNTDTETEFRGIMGLSGDYNFAENFTVGASLGLDYTNIEILQIIHPNSIRGIATPNVGSEKKGSQREGFLRRVNFITNAFLRYNKQLTEKLNFTASVYGEYNYGNNQVDYYQAFGLNPALVGSGSAFTSGSLSEGDNVYNYIPDVASTETELALASYFTTFDLDYNDKYGISGAVRRDITSRFPKNPAGTFWSVAGRWNIDKESFMENVNWVNNLKLRVSYGLVGNQNVGNRYQGLQGLESGDGYQLGTGYTLNTDANGNSELIEENIKWETTSKLNVGLGFSLFDRRLTGEFDAYREYTTDLFSDIPVSYATTGYSIKRGNGGELSNTGIDLQLSYDILRKSDSNPWAFNINAQANYNKNKVESLVGESGFTGNALRSAVGRPLRSWFMTRWAGVDPSNGQPLYLTKDGDITNVYSPDDAVYLDKSADPTYSGGFGTKIEYNGFSLNANFSFATDVWRQNSSLAIIEDAGLAGFANMSTSLLNAWTTPGQVTDIPSLSYGGLRAIDGDRYIEDASFLRLRNVNLAYEINPEVLEKAGLFTRARIFVQGTNLFTWTKWRGFDPEGRGATAFFDYPVSRAYTLGLNLTF